MNDVGRDSAQFGKGHGYSQFLHKGLLGGLQAGLT